MTLVSTFCFLIAVVILLSCLPRSSNIFSPARIFGLTWAMAIGLTDLKFSGFQHEWGQFSWFMLLIPIGSFSLGLFAVMISRLSDRPLLVDSIRVSVRTEGVEEAYLFRIIIALFLLYGFSYTVEWANFGTLPIFAAFPDKARNEFPMFGLHIFVGLMPVILFLIVEYLILVPSNLRRKISLLIIFLIVAMSSLLLLNRLFYLFFLVIVFVFVYYTTNRLKARSILIYVGGFLGFLSVLQYFREVRYARNFIYVVSEMKYSETFAILTGPYMYIVMNLENFARAVERLEHHTFGYFTFDYLMALVGLKHWLATYFGLEERVFLISGYNTFPFFWPFYYDFGVLGLFVLPFALGFGIACVFSWLVRSANMVSITAYAIAVYVMVISFFTNSLTSLNFNVNVVVLIIVQILVRRRGQAA